jgi:arylformamidase
MYDLHPVLLSARSSYVVVSPDEIDALSPQRHLERLRCPITVAYGGHESPEFQRQAREFTAALRAASRPVELVYAEGVNHFDMLDLLGAKDGPLAHAALRQMGLA